MAVREIKFEDLHAAVGEELGVSDWIEVTQENVNKFADVTMDHQWIHIDEERAKKESPYGGTIAHGYFTLSLVPYLMAQIWRASGMKMGVNYGLNKLRFPAPVPIGKKVRGRAVLADVKDVKGGVQVQLDITIEVEDSEKPACFAEGLFRYYN